MNCRLVSLIVGCTLLAGAPSALAQSAGTPANLRVTIDGNTARLRWDYPTTGGVSFFRVYVNNDAGVSVVGVTPVSTSLTHVVTLPDEGRYTAFVDAQNGAAVGAAASVQFTIGDVPNSPLEPAATVSGSTVRLRWQAPMTPAGRPVRGYQVELQSLDFEETCPLVSVGPAITEVVLPALAPPVPCSTLRPGTHIARVRAVNLAGLSHPSSDAVFTIGPPVPFFPRNLRAAVDGHNVTLTWNVRNDSPVASSFVLLAGSRPGIADIGTFELATPSTSVQFLGVPLGTYYLRLVGRNAAGLSYLPSNEIPLVVPEGGSCTGPFDSPHSLSSRVSGNSVTLEWRAPSATGRQLTGYVIQAGTAPGLSNLANFSTGNPNTAIAGVVGSGVYYVRVRAQDVCGISGPSNEVVVFVP